MQAIIIIKDASEFGKVDLQGIHRVLESERDVYEVLHSIDRDGFWRAFVYVKGIYDASFDVLEVGAMLREFEIACCTVAWDSLPIRAIHERLVALLTFTQYREAMNRPGTYYDGFTRAAKISKKKRIKELCERGIKYCQLAGWDRKRA